MPSVSALSRTKPILYTGVGEYEATSEQLKALYRDGKIEIPPFYTFNQNQYIIAKTGDNQSALARYNGVHLHLLDQQRLQQVTDIRPRNKEQYFAMDALTDDAIKVVTLTGKAGSGKTLMALAAAIKKKDGKQYKKIILTKPSSQVGRRDLGILPGTLEEKFMPFLINYQSNLEVLFGDSFRRSSGKVAMEDLFYHYNIEIVPLQLLRGASFNNALIIADEVQVLDHHEMLTLGTRISEGSKLIIMGDLNQRDEKIQKEDTGLFKFINDSKVKNSSFTASVHMLKSERGEVSALFSSVFESD